MAEVKQVSFAPLKGPNFATWKVQCTMALKKDGLWGIVSGREETPEGARERECFAGRQDKALATIVLSVDPSLLYLIGDPVDPVAVWKKLEDQFQKKSWVNRLNLRRKLHSLRLKDDESVQGHVKSMLEIFNELLIVGDTITDEDRVVYLLASLPESFDTLVTALESNPTVPEMEIVIERLMHEERKLKDRQESGSDGALAARHKTRSKGPRCYGCQKFGHIQRNCPERTRPSTESSKSYEYSESKREGKKGMKNEVHKTQVEWDSSSGSEIGLMTSTHQLSSTQDNWIVDSGATCHICNNRRSFVEIHPLKKPQLVTLGDGHELSATETGDVTLELLSKDGKTKRCRLHDVLYVPELEYNLLSVTKATEAGKRVKFDSNDCQLLDQDDKVVAVGVRRGSLYYLSCQQVKDDQVHVSDARLNAESKEFIWHRRFGHLNERSLHTLASQKFVNDFDYNTSKQMPFCESCVEGKIHKNPFPS